MPDVIARQQRSEPDVVVISWSWDETHHILASRRGRRSHNLPLTEEYLRCVRAGLSTANVAMSVMVQAGRLLVADGQGRELVREPITVPLASVDRLTAETLQTALEKSMPVMAMSGHTGVSDTARLTVFILHCDGAASNDKIRQPAPQGLAEACARAPSDVLALAFADVDVV